MAKARHTPTDRSTIFGWGRVLTKRLLVAGQMIAFSRGMCVSDEQKEGQHSK